METMNTFADINDSIKSYINTFMEKYKKIESNDSNKLLRKSEMLSELPKILSDITGTLKYINDLYTTEKRNLEDDITTNLNNINKAKKMFNNVNNNNSTWAKIAETPQVVEHEDNKTYVNKTVQHMNGSPKPVNYQIADGVHIPAYTIDHPEECHKYKGWFCWSPRYSRFYISINGLILSGVTTIILPAKQKPMKFHVYKFCKDGKICDVDYKKTEFYVPPECTEEPNKSEDVRCFTNRMCYVPASVAPEKHEICCYRIGSKDNLSDDLKHISRDDYKLYSDMTDNFLLIWYAAAREMINRRHNEY